MRVLAEPVEPVEMLALLGRVTRQLCARQIRFGLNPEETEKPLLELARGGRVGANYEDRIVSGDCADDFRPVFLIE